MLKSLFAALAVTTALGFPAAAMAKPVTFTTTLKDYGGNGAYLALYVTDKNGAYAGSLWMAGGKSKYYKHLLNWARGSGGKRSEYDGMTGASVTSGASLTITVDIDDTLIDAGYRVLYMRTSELVQRLQAARQIGGARHRDGSHVRVAQRHVQR